VFEIVNVYVFRGMSFRAFSLSTERVFINVRVMKQKALRGVGINVILLGVVSFLTDTSSEMMLPILPMFITALGGTALIVGLIGGLGDSLSSVLQVFSGHWSDNYGKRKPFVLSGYTVSAISKLFLPLCTIWGHVLILRPLDKVGKGLRTAPRDAIIAGSCESEVRGKAFGIHRTMDTGGAVLGSAMAFILFWFLSFGFRPILVVSAVIAFFALAPLYPLKEEERKPCRLPLRIGLRELPRDLRLFLFVATVFALGNFTYMFFILRAQEIFVQMFAERVAFAMPILLYVMFNVVYTIFSIPSGILSDKIGGKNVLLLGYLLFGLTCLGFALADSLLWFAVLFCFYGLFYALVNGNQRAFASNLVPEELRGTALGTFHTFIGLATLPASLIAGALWLIDPSMTFVYGAILGIGAGVLLKLCFKAS